MPRRCVPLSSKPSPTSTLPSKPRNRSWSRVPTLQCWTLISVSSSINLRWCNGFLIVFFRNLSVCDFIELQYRRGLYRARYSAFFNRWCLRCYQGLYDTCGRWTVSHWATQRNFSIPSIFYHLFTDFNSVIAGSWWITSNERRWGGRNDKTQTALRLARFSRFASHSHG